ncbi:MAG: nucleotidyltransferase domain-containing protein [Anaerolineae bacterium]
MASETARTVDLTALSAEIVRRVRAVCEPERIIIFGSYARGEVSPDSDLDVMVVRETEAPLEDSVSTRRALRGLGLPIDVIVVSPRDLELYGSDPYLIYSAVLREGIVVYEHAAPQFA